MRSSPVCVRTPTSPGMGTAPLSPAGHLLITTRRLACCPQMLLFGPERGLGGNVSPDRIVPPPHRRHLAIYRRSVHASANPRDGHHPVAGRRSPPRLKAARLAIVPLVLLLLRHRIRASPADGGIRCGTAGLPRDSVGALDPTHADGNTRIDTDPGDQAPVRAGLGRMAGGSKDPLAALPSPLGMVRMARHHRPRCSCFGGGRSWRRNRARRFWHGSPVALLSTERWSWSSVAH